MRDAGYTAMEALAALAILGLALGGLTGGLKVIALGESRAAAKVAGSFDLGTADRELAALVQGQGPFRSDEPDAFTGDARSFEFPCGSGTCGAELTDVGLTVTQPPAAPRTIPLSGADRLQFSYVGSQSQVPAWPAAPPSGTAQPWQVLQTILLQDAASGEPVVATRITIQQAADCQYDGIIKDCRKVGA